MSSQPEKLYISYNIIHKLCRKAAFDLKAKGKRVDLIIGISGGGLIPARICRTFLKQKGEKNIPIQAIGLSLYEEMGGQETIGKEVKRTQWLDFGALTDHFDSLIGKHILIVDEVDDTRTTLHYAVNELMKDVSRLQKELGREAEETTFSVFVLHNKLKEKKADLPADMMAEGRYLSGEDVPDAWIAYPWDADDIDEHTKLATEQGNI